jgi:histidine triad (HIT) family protein
MIKGSEEKSDEEPGNERCVFCSIASDKIKSVKLEENEKAIAILEINPISKGHTLIIPKEHLDKSPKQALSLAKKVSKKIEKKFSPKSIEIAKSKMFGHEVINLIPIYNKENINSERKTAKIEELEEIKKELEKTKEKKIKKAKVEKIKEFFWLPKRIP